MATDTLPNPEKVRTSTTEAIQESGIQANPRGLNSSLAAV